MVAAAAKRHLLRHNRLAACRTDSSQDGRGSDTGYLEYSSSRSQAPRLRLKTGRQCSCWYGSRHQGAAVAVAVAKRHLQRHLVASRTYELTGCNPDHCRTDRAERSSSRSQAPRRSLETRYPRSCWYGSQHQWVAVAAAAAVNWLRAAAEAEVEVATPPRVAGKVGVRGLEIRYSGMARSPVLQERRRVCGDVWARGQAGRDRMPRGC